MYYIWSNSLWSVAGNVIIPLFHVCLESPHWIWLDSGAGFWITSTYPKSCQQVATKAVFEGFLCAIYLHFHWETEDYSHIWGDFTVNFGGDCCGYVVIFSSASFNSNHFKTKLFPDIQSNAGQRIKLWWNIAFVNLKIILKDFSIPSNNSRHTPSLSFWMLEVIFTTVSSVAATVTGGFWARLFVVVF